MLTASNNAALAYVKYQHNSKIYREFAARFNALGMAAAIEYLQVFYIVEWHGRVQEKIERLNVMPVKEFRKHARENNVSHI